MGTQKDVTLNASKFDVFISYSRRDQPFVRRLYHALGEQQSSAWVDWEGIPPTADWMREVFAAIESADNFVFVLSVASLASEVCAREVEHAVKSRKRLIPLVWGQVDAAQTPAELSRLNWIICAGDDDFPRAFASLRGALTTDLEWVREHTRLLVRAVDWGGSRTDGSLLLRGADLREAEQWLARGADEEPKPTELHRDYVISSRTQETRRARRTLAVVVAGLILAIALAVVAWVQRQEAQEQRVVAEQRREEAERRRIEAERQSVVAFTNESNASLSLGRELEALIAAVKAGKKLQQEGELRDGSKSVYRALVALRRAIHEGRERNRIDSGHFRGAEHLAFSPDGESLYSAGGGGDIRRWSVDGRPLSSFETEHGMGDGCIMIQNFAVSPDGNTLATIGNEGGFVLWSPTGARTGGFDLQVPFPGDGSCGGIFNSKIDFASRTVTVREEEQESVWSFAGQLVNRTPMAPATEEMRQGNQAVTSADGALIARRGADRTLAVRRRDGAEVLRLRHQRSPAFSQLTGRMATVSDDVDRSVIHIWDLIAPDASPPESAKKREARPPKRTLRLGDRDVELDSTSAFKKFTGVLSPDGRIAAVVSGFNGGTVSLWRLPDASTGASAERIAEFDTEQLAGADFSEALESLSFSPDSQLLASGGSDGTMKFWGLDGKLVRKFVAHSLPANARFDPDGRLLLTWGDIRKGEVGVKLWSVDGELLDSLSKLQVNDAWFSADGRWILATGEGTAQKPAWSLDLDQLLSEGCELLRLYLANPATEDRGLCP